MLSSLNYFHNSAAPPPTPCLGLWKAFTYTQKEQEKNSKLWGIRNKNNCFWGRGGLDPLILYRKKNYSKEHLPTSAVWKHTKPLTISKWVVCCCCFCFTLFVTKGPAIPKLFSPVHSDELWHLKNSRSLPSSWEETEPSKTNAMVSRLKAPLFSPQLQKGWTVF